MEGGSFYDRRDKDTLKKVQLFSNLPEPTLLQIVFDLNVKEIESAGFTVAKWKQIVNTEKVWSSLVLGDFRGFSALTDQAAIGKHVGAIISRLSSVFDTPTSKFKFIYTCFAKMFLITPRYGVDALFTVKRMMAKSKSENMAQLFPYLDDTNANEYLSLITQIGITDAVMKKMKETGVSLQDFLSNLLRNPKSFRKDKILKLLIYLRKSTKFAAVSSMHWNGIYMKPEGINSYRAGLGYVHNYVNVNENDPTHNFYMAQQNPFIIAKEEKKRLFIQNISPVWEVVDDIQKDENGYYMDPLLLISQVLTLETVADEVNSSYLIGVKQSSDILTRPNESSTNTALSYFRLWDNAGDFKKAMSMDSDTKIKELLAFVSQMRIDILVTANDLSKRIRDDLSEQMKKDLDDYYLIERDDVSVQDLTAKLDEYQNNPSMGNYSSTRKFYLSNLTDKNSVNISVNVKALRVVDDANSPTLLFGCSLRTIEGDSVGMCEIEIAKAPATERVGVATIGPFYNASLKASQIDAFWLLRQKINNGLLDHLVSNKDRTSIYYSKPLMEKVKGKKRISSQTVANINCGKQDHEFTIEKVIDSEGKVNYMIYDKNNANLYCEHIHEDIEKLQAHIKANRRNDLCPKCCN
jgi:hypothetical protein